MAFATTRLHLRPNRRRRSEVDLDSYVKSGSAKLTHNAKVNVRGQFIFWEIRLTLIRPKHGGGP